jgi:hypothetical protein
MNNPERCPGCGGLIAIIGTRHRCSGALLGKAHDEARPPIRVVTKPVRTATEPLPLNVRTTETAARNVSRSRAASEERTEIQERKPAPRKGIVTIDKAVAGCPVCAARRAKERRKKERQRIRKAIPRTGR